MDHCSPRPNMDDINPHEEPPTTQNNETLETNTLLELSNARESIRRAREAAIESWIDNMPTMNELEKLRLIFSTTRNMILMTATAAASLETLIESTTQTISLKQAEHRKDRAAIQEMREAKHGTRKETARLESETETRIIARAKLKEELHVRRHSLRTLQLTQSAVAVEVEALNVSTDGALRRIKHLKRDHRMVEIPIEEHVVLTKNAEVEDAAAEWRVAAAENQRRGAAERKAEAFWKLEALCVAKQQERGSTSYKMKKVRASPVLLHTLMNENERSSGKGKEIAKRESKVMKLSIIKRVRNFIVHRLMGFWGL